MKFDQTRVKTLLDQVFDELQTVEDRTKYATVKDEFVFHMTDWIENLEELLELYERPGQNKAAAAKTVAGFLYHAVPHLNAAGRLLLDKIPDVFEQGER